MSQEMDPNKYGAALFGDYLKNSSKQGKANRNEYVADFKTVQDTGLAGDARARAAAISFLDTMGAHTREAALSGNPDLKNRLGQLNDAAGDIGPSDISQRLHDQALHELDLGGSLSPDEIRQVTQGTRAGFADRGLSEGNPALFEEAMNRAQYSNARLRERQGFAAGVDAQEYGQKQGDRSFLTQVTAEDQSYDPAMQMLGINSTPAAAGSQSLTQSTGQAPLAVAGIQQDYWNTIFNANAAADIADKNRAAGLQSAQMNASAASGAGRSSMIGAGIGAGGAIAGAAIIAL